ncbi:MAG TPA: rod shape-determining protein MreC [Acidobacteriaceae bacterium]|nr:rod shape-determining protein MreC [Acidobacteriaceae bacterium]
MDLLLRFRNALVLIAVLLAQALALAVQVRTPSNAADPDTGSVRLIRRWTSAVITPFERVTHSMGLGVRGIWNGYIDLRHIRRQNQELRDQLTQMRIQEAAIAEDAAEGRRLQALLAFKQKYVASTVAAQVIGSSGSDLSHVVTIDKGARDGLKPDMAVITSDGIVGKVRDVFPTSAQVLEINDQNSGAGVILATTRIRAILHGTAAGQAEIGNLMPDSRIKPGEQVITSGGDQVYPRGLPVGTIQSIRPDSDHPPYTAIVVHPAVDLNRLEEVLVITGTQPDLPASAEQDLIDAEARHAADVRAERLPSIDDSDDLLHTANGAASPAATPPPAADQRLVIPKPLPALHTDRYSSGATPPAADLTPGSTITPQAVQPAPSTQHSASQPASSGSRPDAPQ